MYMKLQKIFRGLKNIVRFIYIYIYIHIYKHIYNFFSLFNIIFWSEFFFVDINKHENVRVDINYEHHQLEFFVLRGSLCVCMYVRLYFSFSYSCALQIIHTFFFTLDRSTVRISLSSCMHAHSAWSHHDDDDVTCW